MKVEFSTNRLSQQNFKSGHTVPEKPCDDRIHYEQVKLKKQLLQTQYSQAKLGVINLYKQGLIDKDEYNQRMSALQKTYVGKIDMLDTKEKELQFCYYL